MLSHAFQELAALQERYAGASLLEYVEKHLFADRPHLPLDPACADVFAGNFQEPVRRVSTGAHSCFLMWDDPVFLGESILPNLPHILNGARPVVSAPCSRISFKSSFRPGVVNLSGMRNGSIRLSKYSVRGRSKTTVNKAPSLTGEEMGPFLSQLRKFQNNAAFAFIDSERLALLIRFAETAISKGASFNAQASWLSANLWPHLFNGIDAAPLQIAPMEELKLKRENLFAVPATREALERNFAGVKGAFSSTYFYYGSCRCGIEFPLFKAEWDDNVYLEGSCLDKSCPYYGTRKYAVNVRDIVEEVENKNIAETLLMSFYNIWALAGVDVMGGWFQADYLTDFKRRLIRVFEETGNGDRARTLERRSTNLIDTGIFIAFNRDGTPKTGSQILLEGGLDRDFIERFSRLRFSAAYDAAIEVINGYVGKEPDHQKTLRLLRENDMEVLIR